MVPPDLRGHGPRPPERRPGRGWGPTSVARLLSTTTTTHVAGCPNGGPIAALTVPLATGGEASASGFGPRATLRILNNSGTLLCALAFPPRDLHRSPGDVLALGFTARCVLVIVLRDSLTLCYDLQGQPVLPPFFATSPAQGQGGKAAMGTDLLEARIFEGGVAVLGVDMNAAVVELLDECDDPAYADGADAAARRVGPAPAPGAAFADEQAPTGSASTSPLASPSHYALVTSLPTGAFARSRRVAFRCLAVLPRPYAPSCRPELFLATSDGSVVVAEATPSTNPNGGITDVDCRARIGGTGGGPGDAAVVAMAFAPNGRFLASGRHSRRPSVPSSASHLAAHDSSIRFQLEPHIKYHRWVAFSPHCAHARGNQGKTLVK